MKILDLRGTWRCLTDEAACFTSPDGRWEGSPFVLPGSACENGIGTPLHYTGETDPDTLRAPPAVHIPCPALAAARGGYSC